MAFSPKRKVICDMVLFICGHGGTGRLEGFRCCHLGERFFRGSSPRTFFGKSRLACFYKRGSSVTLRHGFPRRVKTEDNKIAAGIPAAHICGYGGNGRLGGFRFLCREACGFESHYPYQVIRTLWINGRKAQ